MSTANPVSGIAGKEKNGGVRRNIPLRERVAGWVILAMLGAIAVVIIWKGSQYDPGKFALRPEALSSTAEEVAGKASTIRVSERSDAPEVSPYESRLDESRSGSSSARDGEPLNVDVTGVEPVSDTEFYTEDTLYEKINGRAPVYFEFEFQNLRARSFAITGTRGSFIDVLEFEMSSPVTAFGIFSAEREENGKALDFADDGYRSEMGYFLRQGPRYVQIIASDQNPETLRQAEALARVRARTLPSGNEGLEAMQRLPKSGLIPASVEFVQSNAFGLAALHDVYKARYAFEGKEIEFFVMVSNRSEARTAWQEYKDFAGKYGEVQDDSLVVNGGRIFVAESFGNWLAVYFRGDQIGGVVEAPAKEVARGFVTAFLAEK